MKDKFLFIGHRGTRVDFDENSFRSFDKAIEVGVDYIEIDLRITKDNNLIILNPSYLDDVSDGVGLIKALDSNEIRNYRLNTYNSIIPLFSEVLTKYGNKVKFIVDLKDKNISREAYKEMKYLSMINKCVISSKYLSDLITIKLQDPKVQVCYGIVNEKILTNFLNSVISESVPIKIDMISIKSNLVRKSIIDFCIDHDIISLAWGFFGNSNPFKTYKEFIDLGIDGILFDKYSDIVNLKINMNS